MDLKELKTLADTLDDNGKREFIYFLQTRTTGVAVPIRAIDKIHEQRHKEGLICQLCKNHSVVRFEKYAVKIHVGVANVNVTVVNPVAKRSMILQILHCNERGDLIFGFDLFNV